MKTFSRLSLFTLVWLTSFAFMLVGNTVDVHAQVSSLKISGITGTGKIYIVNDPEKGKVEAQFLAQTDGNAAKGIELTITSSPGIRIDTISEQGMTNLVGIVTVTGTLTSAAWDRPKNSEGYYLVSISAEWQDKDKEASQDFMVEIEPSGDAPVIIVVNQPKPKSDLKVGDTFTQMISIENRDSLSRNTLRLSAWQMDVVFNPSILEVVDITEGDFLEKNGDDALFISNTSRGRISVSQALAGHTGISLAPGDPGDQGTLLTIEFKVLAFAEEALGIHNILLQSDQDKDEDGTPDRISYAIIVKDVFVATKHQTYIYEKEDVNQDEMIDILDLMLVAGSIGTLNPRADVNGDGFVNVLDLVTIYKSLLWAKPAPRTPADSWDRDANDDDIISAPATSRNVDPATIQSWIDHAQAKDDGSVIFERGIANLETLLNSRVSTKTRLLLNYPNPFNPETWIPYQLAEATDVTVTIYSVNGTPIRTLSLGHQPAGTYISKASAAYWDGQNELGEKAASGLYFYTFTAGKFSATGKMLIRK